MNKVNTKILKKAIWLSEPNLKILKSDFKNPKRRIILNKSSINRPGTSGSFNSKKCKKVIHYESQLEMRFFIALEIAKDVVNYGFQPLKITYRADDFFYDYYPDFYYILQSGECIIGEIKPINEMGYYSNWLKWKSLKNYCKSNGVGLLITDGNNTISDLNNKEININFRNAIFQEFKKYYAIEWDKIYELKQEFNISMNQLVYLVIQEKIKWLRKPSRFENRDFKKF